MSAKPSIPLSAVGLKAALTAAAKRDVRWYLNGVLVEVSPTQMLLKGGARKDTSDWRDITIMGTNGFLLTASRDQEMSEFPALTVFIPRHVLGGIGRDPVLLSMTGTEGVYALHVRGEERLFRGDVVKPINWRSVVPVAFDEKRPFIAPGLLSLACRIAALHGDRSAVFRSSNGNKSTWTNGHALIVVMGLREEGIELIDIPRWAYPQTEAA